MGQWKEQLIRGYFDIGEKYVCENCFDDYAIKEFIVENAVKKHCDYCGLSSNKKISAPIDDVLSFIMDGIYSGWSDPGDEGVPWESREGGWQGYVIDSYDLIRDQWIVPTENEEILEDITNAIAEMQWCRKNFYQLPLDDALIFGWERFSKKVKHSTRYVFFQARDESNTYEDPDDIPTYAMLEKLENIISEANLIKNINKGKKIFRVRIHNPSEIFNTAKDLGTPKLVYAKFSNRMSPAGIPMFYGAFSIKTAIAETFEKGHKEPKVATIATFKTTKNLKILDLTNLPDIPSIFDPEKRNIRSGIIFLHSFVIDVSKPIIKDGKEHIEYVPTQIFTEYFRHIFVDKDNDNINGIFFNSSKDSDGVSCVLFFENKNCCDSPDATKSDCYLELVKTERKNLNTK